MAALDIASTATLKTSARTKRYTAGEAITAMQVVKLVSGEVMVAWATTSDDTVLGVALHAAGDGEAVVVVVGGGIDPGWTSQTTGAYYLTSDTAQLSVVTSDIDAGDYMHIVGYLTSDDNFVIDIVNTGETL